MDTNNELILLGDYQRAAECNSGTVKAQRENNYTSRLIILNSSLSGSSIECIHDNGTNPNVIGTMSVPTITTSSGKLNSCTKDDIISNDCCRVNVCMCISN